MIRVRIGGSFYKDTVGILFEEVVDGRVTHVAKHIELEFVPRKDGEEIEPTIELGRHIADEFLEALAEALDKKGIKTDNDAKLQGILEAKDVHLKDMRRLVFNNMRSKG